MTIVKHERLLLSLFFALSLVACSGENSTIAGEDSSSSSVNSNVTESSSDFDVESYSGETASSSSAKKSWFEQDEESSSSKKEETSSSAKNESAGSSESSSSSKTFYSYETSYSSEVLDAVDGDPCPKEGAVEYDFIHEYYVECIDGVYNWHWRFGPDHDFFIDNRDGQKYAYSTIGLTTIMVQNLNYGTPVPGLHGEHQDDESKVEKFCYNDDSTHCAHYGGLYQWHEAMGLPDSCMFTYAGACMPNTVKWRGICPEGWHIPNETEWNELSAHKIWNQMDMKLGGSPWSDGGGSNGSGFSALPSGKRNSLHDGGGYEKLYSLAEYWLNQPSRYKESLLDSLNVSVSLENKLNSMQPGIYNTRKDAAFSVRCAKD